MTEDYKTRYNLVFNKDFDFSRAYSKDANKVMLQELATIIDYETQVSGQPHPMDQQGYDRKINISFGFGTRTRNRKDAHFADFTVDYKEYSHIIEDPHYYYFYAYAQPPPFIHKLNFWMIFDYRGLKRLHRQGIIKPTSERNNQHSTVGFFGFKIADLFKNNLIIAYEGEQDILSELGLPERQNTRIDRIMEM